MTHQLSVKTECTGIDSSSELENGVALKVNYSLIVPAIDPILMKK